VPVCVLLDRQVPCKPGVRAVAPEHHFLGTRGGQSIPRHANTLANTAVISGEVKRHLLFGPKAGRSTPRSQWQ
jgi:hypothetical protein